MTFTKLCTGMLLVASMSGSAHAANSTVTMQDRQQAACYNDVQKLCSDEIPDVDKVTACMATKRMMVSPSCAKFYEMAPAG